MMAEDWEAEARTRRLTGPDVLDQVRDLLDGNDSDEADSTVVALRATHGL